MNWGALNRVVLRLTLILREAAISAWSAIVLKICYFDSRRMKRVREICLLICLPSFHGSFGSHSDRWSRSFKNRLVKKRLAAAF
jgi:hypothetical protein